MQEDLSFSHLGFYFKKCLSWVWFGLARRGAGGGHGARVAGQGGAGRGVPRPPLLPTGKSGTRRTGDCLMRKNTFLFMEWMDSSVWCRFILPSLLVFEFLWYSFSDRAGCMYCMSSLQYYWRKYFLKVSAKFLRGARTLNAFIILNSCIPLVCCSSNVFLENLC